MVAAGQNLRALREQLGLTMRDVEMASAKLAQKHQNDEFILAPSRLSDIETKGILPSIYRLYSLSVIYRRDPREILSWYGIDWSRAAADVGIIVPPKSHLHSALASAPGAEIPIRFDPSFDLRKTANLGRVVEQWGLVPMTYLTDLANRSYSYGYIGSEDFTMFPLLPPGSFIQVDESRNHVTEATWRSEYERPIYFVETREGHTCCWCALRKDNLVLQPHPLSPVSVRILKHPQEAEVIGQVVGVAMRLGDWVPSDSLPSSKPPSVLN
jgi:transcriptional regulator with XRE-family HTH domain